jgi:CheY-like chemotaxis protein
VDERLPVRVTGDAARLRQVLLNLAGNAIKFTSEGGVALIVEPGTASNEIRFLVRDTGIGIAPEARGRIFREFEQAGDHISRHYGGTGLGLSISERIVKRMGGRITLESEPGAGSTFEVSVPLPAAPGGIVQPKFVTPDLAGQSIMLIGAPSIEAALVARRLQRWGARTWLISDAREAMALLHTRSWHAVMIDHRLGAGTVETLGDAARGHATLRLLTVTPATRHEIELPGGFTGYLVKPLRAASLAERLTTTAQVGARATAVASLPPDGRNDAPGEPAKTSLSILVAEDNDINALLMRSLLSRLGHRAVIVADGEAALDSWLAAISAGVPYDLVLMDVQMPQLDGIEAAKRIRAHEAARAGSRTPILALTANTLAEDRHACSEAGMDGVLTKPLDREKLSDALAGLSAARHVAA